MASPLRGVLPYDPPARLWMPVRPAPFEPRDLGPPTAVEILIVRRILLRAGYPVPAKFGGDDREQTFCRSSRLASARDVPTCREDAA